MSRGSEWRKWDLHVHTPDSFHNGFTFSDETERTNYRNQIWGKYINALEEISDISVIGITDYFSIEGYKKVLEYKQKGRLQNFDLILPNIEFRLDTYVDKRRLNYHVILSDEIDVDTIEKEFLERIDIQTADSERRALNRRNIEEIGRALKEEHENFRNKTDYVIGCQNITISLSQIREILEGKASIFEGKYLLILPEEGWSDIKWDGQDHLIRKRYYKDSHALFSSNDNTRDWALGKKHEDISNFLKEFGSLKPCIHGSDAHSFEKICNPDQNRYCWIKADPCFEGLKQIIYEPEERVRIQSEDPEYRKNIFTLDSLKLSNSKISDDLIIDEFEMRFNKNLVTVTGGKGCGKTALLDLIANCFEDRCKRKTNGKKPENIDRNSFVQRIQDQNGHLQVELSFTGDTEKFSKALTEEKFFDKTNITYLPQGKIEEYSGNSERLNKKIKEIIFNNPQIKSHDFKQNYDDTQNIIEDLKHTIEQYNYQIFNLEKEASNEIFDDINLRKKVKEGEIQDKENLLNELTKNLDEGVKSKIDTLKSEEHHLRVRHSKFESLKLKLLGIETSLVAYSQNFEKSLSEIIYILEDLGISEYLQPISFELQLGYIRNTIDQVLKEIEKINLEIQTVTEELKLLSGVEKTHSGLLNDLKNLNEELETIQNQLKVLEEKKRSITEIKRERLSSYIELVKKYFEWKDCYRAIIDSFSNGKSSILGEIDFQAQVIFDHSKFYEIGEDLFDLRKLRMDDIKEFSEKLEKLIAGDESVDIKDLFDTINEKTNVLKRTRTHLDFYNWAYANYYHLNTDIFYKGTPMHKLSMGQKGTVLLKLFLAEGGNTIILDQPEENLDNKFIYDELVASLREAKKKRQIIIATNNANLVVNTDAEQIIVAEFDNNHISYHKGTLEDLCLREEIMPILEGGKIAFKKRERKYEIRN